MWEIERHVGRSVDVSFLYPVFVVGLNAAQVVNLQQFTDVTGICIVDRI